jgi:acetylornithine/succinyldiaminopimelate/putrescine aminotransferase
MFLLADAPVLGHITTFGGHPISCAAGMAAMEVLIREKMMDDVKRKEDLFRSLLIHPAIRQVNSFGLWLALKFDSFDTNKCVIDRCIDKGVLTDWFLFAADSLRISPPLMISEEEIRLACQVILEAIDS